MGESRLNSPYRILSTAYDALAKVVAEFDEDDA